MKWLASPTPTQQSVIGRVMREFKDGDLESSSGDKVRNRKQAIAIALSESGSSNQQTPAQNRHALDRTKRRPGGAAGTRSELYAQARKEGIPGRSRMNKEQLTRALAK